MLVIYPGQIVVSLAGRDKDKYFVVLDVIDNSYCHISDGNIRKTDKPKKKKIKHLRFTGEELSVVKVKLESKETVTNSLIKNELRKILNNQRC